MKWPEFKSTYLPAPSVPALIDSYLKHHATSQDHDVTFCHIFRDALDSHGITGEDAYRLRNAFILMDEYLDALESPPQGATLAPATHTPAPAEEPTDAKEVALENYREIFKNAMREGAYAPAVAAQNAINKLLGLAVDEESGNMEGMTLPFEKMSLGEMNKEIQRMEEILEQFNAIRVSDTAKNEAKADEGVNLDSGAFGGGAETAPSS